ncbi:MAG TPA: ABC transporter ATP-binding protein [Pseudonocardiaceae bacterium]
MNIEVRDLRLNYGSVTALDEVTFSLEGGKIYGLLGRNGSGKTSLLSVLAGFRRATSGTVLLDGQPVFENPRATREICLIRDNGEAIKLGNAEDAFTFAAWLRPQWDAALADELMEYFGLDRKKPVKQMSKGQRSALGVVVGLASRAPVTILDEAYLGMDAPTRQRFYDVLLEDYLAHPRTIILATHLIEEVSRLFEEVLILDRGRLLLHEPADTLLSRGVTVVGPAERVDAFARGRTVLDSKQLGGTKSVTVYGALSEEDRARARAEDLELEPVTLQDLFIHLTAHTGGQA